jgi:hypothetical protein
MPFLLVGGTEASMPPLEIAALQSSDMVEETPSEPVDSEAMIALPLVGRVGQPCRTVRPAVAEDAGAAAQCPADPPPRGRAAA